MFGIIIGVGVLLLAIRFFTRDQTMDWRTVGFWLVLSYIPFILIMIFAFISEHIGIWMYLLALLLQLGVLFYVLENHYGSRAATKILASYTVAMLIVRILI